MKNLIITILVILISGCGTEKIYGGLSEKEANKILALLISNGIKATKQEEKKGLMSVMVGYDDIAVAINLLEKNNLPSQKYDNIPDIFSGDGVITSKTEEKARYVYALSQELGETIGSIDGVITSRVHVVMPVTNETGETVTPASASVLIKHRPEYNLNSHVTNIKLLVSKSIDNLDYNQVFVMLYKSSMKDVMKANPMISGNH